ncbi:TPA: hypothetical protein HA361_02485 [Candidatus Woesearchaeota archaeon]|nr:hypothetical protein [Candidatus Woesearchaeota archaeon]HII69249.1 hypothetical protein [Candidatus Woesearchaeota archaeon]
MIARITEIEASNKTIERIIAFDHSLSTSDEQVLLQEFDCGKEMIELSLGIYRNVAVIINLFKVEEGRSAEWKAVLDRHFPRRGTLSKLDNTFVSKAYDKLLLITNRRLVSVDIRKINEKIDKINNDIELANREAQKEFAVVEEEEFDIPRPGFFSKMKAIFR